MLSQNTSSTSPISDSREARVQALLEQLQPNADQILRQMAENLVDLPEDKSFGQIEYTLRDLAHELASSCHQTGLVAGKKRLSRLQYRLPPLSVRRPLRQPPTENLDNPHGRGSPPPRLLLLRHL